MADHPLLRKDGSYVRKRVADVKAFVNNGVLVVHCRPVTASRALKRLGFPPPVRFPALSTDSPKSKIPHKARLRAGPRPLLFGVKGPPCRTEKPRKPPRLRNRCSRPAGEIVTPPGASPPGVV